MSGIDVVNEAHRNGTRDLSQISVHNAVDELHGKPRVAASAAHDVKLHREASIPLWKE